VPHKLLGERHLGRLALVDADGPVILPVNYTLDEGSVVFRTDPGSKLDAAAAGATVAFEVDAADERHRTGWSVVVRGRAGEVSEPAEPERLRGLRCTRGRPAPRPATSASARLRLPAGASPSRPICRSPGGAEGHRPRDAEPRR
jgi:nitroimidazol reductase NimA-like FMN-containing flavoprotein (pyridoxamine 5'-phosphate oxidase superfamily)